jgi:hypothetical protein
MEHTPDGEFHAGADGVAFMGRDLSPVARRVPDPPLLSTETTAPYDLPRGEATFVTPEIVIDGSARIPDLVGLDV